MIGQYGIFFLIRVSLGVTFLWAFFDKLFGLGFSTCRDAATHTVALLCDKAWISGGSPTFGFLQFATKGPFQDFYQSIAGHMTVDWLFMAGLLGIGIALMFGILLRLAVVSGVAMMVLMYFAVIPSTTNPLIDDHIIYALVLLLFLFAPARDSWGFNKKWRRITKNHTWLQ